MALFLTPYFYFIPRATLAAVLISAVCFMIDYEIIPVLWRNNSTFLLLFFDAAVSFNYCCRIRSFYQYSNVYFVIVTWDRNRFDGGCSYKRVAVD